MVKKYPYLNDINFLNKIYGHHNKTIYTTITSLDWHERPLKALEGKVVSGSISINGDSSVRRTANLKVQIFNYDELYDSVDSLFSINKKVYLEIGLVNNFAHLGYYSNYPIIYFPFGVFVIKDESISYNDKGADISLTLNDKMALLNGSCGGVLPAAVNFESIDTLGPDGDLHTEYVRINQMIQEMVNHFGGEDLNKIIINDVPDKIKQVLKWRGSNPLYLWMDKNNKENVFYTTIDTSSSLPLSDWNKKKIIYNYDAGYSYVDFVYPGELVSAPGDSVCTILDKIKSTLGNYEYYYDVFGNFIFQEIKNYVNVSEWRSINIYGEQGWDNLKDNDAYLPYDYSTRLNTAVYDFKNSEFVISYSNKPNFEMIKNDFVVWGERTSANKVKLPIRYHLAIDKRPSITEPLTLDFDICFDLNLRDKIRRAIPISDTFATVSDLKEQLPFGIVGKYYRVGNSVYTWINDINTYSELLNNYMSTSAVSAESGDFSIDNTNEDNAGYIRMPLATLYYDGDGSSRFTINPTTNWRNLLYFQGLKESRIGLNANYYWAEMCNEWPKIYDIEHDMWIDGMLDVPTSMDWWLDFIDNNPILNQFSVDAIGRRSYSKMDNGCNCVFEPDIPDIVMVDVNDESAIVDSRSGLTQQRLKELGLIPVQVSNAVYNSVTTGGSFNSLYQHVRQLITDYTNYNESITVSCLPIYHLEPNTRVSFNCPDAGIYGDFIINTISFDLGNGGNMSISAKKCVEKI